MLLLHTAHQTSICPTTILNRYSKTFLHLYGRPQCTISSLGSINSQQQRKEPTRFPKLKYLNNGRPTRISLSGQGKSCPYITVCSPDISRYCTWAVLDVVGTSDHFPTVTTITLNIENTIYNTPISRWNTRKADCRLD